MTCSLFSSSTKEIQLWPATACLPDQQLFQTACHSRLTWEEFIVPSFVWVQTDMSASVYQFPSSVLCPSAESSGRSWPMYDARQPRTRKAGTFGSRDQAVVIQVRKRVQKEKEERHNTNEQVKAEKGPRILFSLEAADALAGGNVSRALQLQQRAQVAASFASGLVTAATEPRCSSLHISGRSSPTASLVSLSGDSGYEETLGSIPSRDDLDAHVSVCHVLRGPGSDLLGSPAVPYIYMDKPDCTNRRHARAHCSASPSHERRSHPSPRQPLRWSQDTERASITGYSRSLVFNSSQTTTVEPYVMPLTRRLAPLPRFDPFMRTRSDSLSSIIYAPNAILTDRTGLVCFARFVRKCKTMGHIRRGYRLDIGYLRCE